jgi:hypothetical protein
MDGGRDCGSRDRTVSRQEARAAVAATARKSLVKSALPLHFEIAAGARSKVNLLAKVSDPGAAEVYV